MATAKVDTDAYLVELDFEELTVDQFIGMRALLANSNNVDSNDPFAALAAAKDVLAPFVQRKDGEPLEEGEAEHFIGALKIKQINQITASFGQGAVPPQNGSAS